MTTDSEGMIDAKVMSRPEELWHRLASIGRRRMVHVKDDCWIVYYQPRRGPVIVLELVDDDEEG